MAVDGELAVRPIDYDDPAVGPAASARARSAWGCAAGELTRRATCGSIRDVYYTGDAGEHAAPARSGSIGRTARARRVLRAGRQQPGLERLAVLAGQPGRARATVPGQAVPGPPAGAGRAAPGLRPVGLLGSRSPAKSVTFDRCADASQRRSSRCEAARERSLERPVAIGPSSRQRNDRRWDGPPPPHEAEDAPARSDAEPPKEGYRETVEAIVVAFILALLVRGFEAEAFVIPTGSMAPTLMGRHKEITCPQCGFVYAVNASEEVEGVAAAERRTAGGFTRGSASTAGSRRRVDDAPSFKGDRILVMKFPYDLPFLPGSVGPQRWDVVVFRYPEEPEVSYIKRLVGLPGETIRIYHGDVYVKPPGSDEFQLARKPLRAPAGDADDGLRRPLSARGAGRTGPSGGAGSQRRRLEARSSRRRAAIGPRRRPATSWAELRYRHLVPDPEQWDAIVERPARCPARPAPTLITDFYSYNTNLTGREFEPDRRPARRPGERLAAAALGRRPDDLGASVEVDLARRARSGSSWSRGASPTAARSTWRPAVATFYAGRRGPRSRSRRGSRARDGTTSSSPTSTTA